VSQQQRRRIVVAVLLLLRMLQETLQKLPLSVRNSIVDKEHGVGGCAATIVVAVEFGREREGEESGRV
jgi:homoserine kinase